MTNSQQEFEISNDTKLLMEKFYDVVDWSEINHLRGYDREDAELVLVAKGIEAVVEACDARWRAKLDEGKIAEIISSILESGEKPRPENIAKAVIEYLTKEEK